ncbi:MAG: lamin tail domain-containing protein, partial [Dehalococcoidia bacterium]|nr:lamin tail domain-containing protein [Dehalococcoidia bacterium]
SGNHSFTFPNSVLEAGKTIRVYTNENHPEWGGFSFKSSAIWNNDEDEAMLYNSQGILVSRMSYEVTK